MPGRLGGAITVALETDQTTPVSPSMSNIAGLSRLLKAKVHAAMRSSNLDGNKGRSNTEGNSLNMSSCMLSD